MSNVDISSDGLFGLDYDSRGYLHSHSWPVTAVDQHPHSHSHPHPHPHPHSHQHQHPQHLHRSHHHPQHSARVPREISPLQTTGHPYDHSVAAQDPLLVDWQFNQLPAHLQYSPPQQPQPHPHDDPSSAPPFTTATASYGIPIQSSPVDLMSAGPQGQMSTGLLDGSYLSLSAPVDMVPFAYQDLQPDLMAFPAAPNGLPDMSPYTASPNVIGSSSPTDTYLEVRSLGSSSSDNGWNNIERRSIDFSFPEQGMFINPNQTLHDRSLSESSYSTSYSSFVDVSNPINSPTSETALESPFNPMPRRVSFDHTSHGSQSPTAVSPVAVVRPIPVPIKKSTSPTRSAASQSSAPSASSASPPTRKPSRKSPIAAKTADTRVRKQSQSSKSEGEKRVGKRKGPLKPDQRKQASEIRKLRACLRCKFLKKTCDKGEPCAGCQPSHARLWQVPCTRIDIKEIGYFMKDWKADYERHISLGFSVGNIKGFSEHEQTLFITHGYGQVLPINAREVYVRDEQCFSVDWVETMHREPTQYEVETAKLSAGMEGISHAMLSDYLDRHIDGNGTFEKFVDDYFEGTPFLTQMLKTAFRYYYRTKLSVIRKALKLIVAYNLTLHVTMVEGLGEEDNFLGKIQNGSSKFNGKTIAPVMINFQIKCAMANMWRELQKDVLEELSGLYSSVYSGDKLKNWPTIFILACILLAVWEEMQFDSHYRTTVRICQISW